MAFTRKFLSALGIEADKVDEIMTAHAEVVDGLKNDRDSYRAKAEKADALEKENAELKKAAEDIKADGYEAKYKDIKKQFDDYKADIAAKDTDAKKDTALAAYLDGKNIKGNNAKLALRALAAEKAAIELDEKGGIKDTSALDKLIGGEFAGLVERPFAQGVNIAHPPANNGGKTTMTKADIMGIKDAAARQKAIAENQELFGI